MSILARTVITTSIMRAIITAAVETDGGEKHQISEIDLLRFFAALAVVFFHYSFRGASADGLSKVSYPLLAPISKYGYLGVENVFH